MSEQSEYKIAGRQSTIFRVKKSADNPYVMIDRRPIDNPALSFKAKGILTYLMSRPDGWEVNITDLMKHGTDGAAAVRSGLQELRDAHHVLYNTEREGGHIKRWVIEVYEIPYSDPLTKEQIEALPDFSSDKDCPDKSLDCDFQQVENLQVGNQQVENRRQVLSTLSNKDSSSKIYIDDPVAAKIAELKFPINPNAPMILKIWAQDWPGQTDVIIRALELSRGKSISYADRVLINWKANGVPPTREQRVESARGQRKAAGTRTAYAESAFQKLQQIAASDPAGAPDYTA